MFGDPRHCYLVEVRTTGGYGGTRALRTLDGAAVPVPDFAEFYPIPRRLAVLGHYLLLSDKDDHERLALRLYDIETGKDTWRQQYPAKSIVVQSELPGLTGVLDPAGNVTVFEARSRKEVFHAMLDPKNVERVEMLSVFRDRMRWYLAIKLPGDNKRNLPEPSPNVQGGLRTAPINGMLYAFDQATGELCWYHQMPNQMILLDQIEESPVLLFAAMMNRQMNPAGQPMPYFATRSLDKRTGKLLLNKESSANNFTPFHALEIDNQSGTVDLVSANLKIRHAVK
jgi:hypothetical protein